MLQMILYFLEEYQLSTGPVYIKSVGHRTADKCVKAVRQDMSSEACENDRPNYERANVTEMELHT
jgi:hypothetical protein